MPQRPELTREAFLSMAEQAGFDRDDPHLEELFPEVRGLLQRVAYLDELDLSGSEPATTFAADTLQE